MKLAPVRVFSCKHPLSKQIVLCSLTSLICNSRSNLLVIRNMSQLFFLSLDRLLSFNTLNRVKCHKYLFAMAKRFAMSLRAYPLMLMLR